MGNEEEAFEETLRNWENGNRELLERYELYQLISHFEQKAREKRLAVA